MYVFESLLKIFKNIHGLNSSFKTCLLNVIRGIKVKNQFGIIICQKFKIRFHFNISNFSHGVFSAVQKLFYSPKNHENLEIGPLSRYSRHVLKLVHSRIS